MAEATKKGEEKQRGLIARLLRRKKVVQGLTAEELFEHPLVHKMHGEIQQLRSLLENLPEAIGRAVYEAQEANRPPGIKVANPEMFELGSAKSDGPLESPFDIKSDMVAARKEAGLEPLPPVPKKAPEKKKE